MDKLKFGVWIFLVLGFAFWSFRLVIIFNAHYDALIMMALSFIIFNNKNY